MSEYIIDNNSNELNTICHTPYCYIISKDVFFASLSKRQTEMIKNNEKTKFLKSLKHLEFIEVFENEICSLIDNKIYTISNTIINKNNILKQLIKYWEKEIEYIKDISKEIPISDIKITEFINAEKSGTFKTVFSNNIYIEEINATYGLADENSSYDKYIITDTINKNINKKEFLIKFLNGEKIKEILSDKKKNSQVLSDSEIERLKKINDKINEFTGTIMDFSFAIKENKIYILETKEVTISETQKLDTLFPNIIKEKYTLTKTNVNYTDYSFYNFLYKTKIKTYCELFFIDELDANLLFYDKNTYEDKNLINNLIKKSATYNFNKTWFNNYVFNIEKTDAGIDYTYFLEISRFVIKLYKEYKNINKNIEIVKDKITTLENLFNNAENKITELIEYLYDIQRIINKNLYIIFYNELYINLIENIIKRKNNISNNFKLYSILDFKIINDLNTISNKIPNEIKNIINSNNLLELENCINEKVDLEIFYDTHKNYFINLDKMSIYKIIANWQEIPPTNISTVKLQNKYQNMIKNVETLTVCINQTYNLYNKILEKIGSKLTFNKEINAISDINYLTINEIITYFNNIPQKESLKSIINNRKKENFKFNLNNNQNTLTFNNLITNLNTLQPNYEIVEDNFTKLLFNCLK